MTMKRIVVAIPHSHTWFWTQTCVTCLWMYPPKAKGYKVDIVVVDNSPWSPAIRGITETPLGKIATVIPNSKNNPFHASALDCVVSKYEFDYLLAMETDVLVADPDWLQWFVDQMKPTDFAVGMWHHEQFVNPSCTLYRGSVLRDMQKWCDSKEEPELLRWGPSFERTQLIKEKQPERDYKGWYDDNIGWIAGPFAEKRGWPLGTSLKEKPSGQDKGPGWYEPGQQLHHWAVEAGYTYTVCPTLTTQREDGLPMQTMYGPNILDPGKQLEASELYYRCKSAHLWGGTRALDILKHEVTCNFVKSNTPYWLSREAKFWKQVVPRRIQEHTFDLIRKYGWHVTGQGNAVAGGDDRDRRAVEYVKSCYTQGGVNW